MTGDISCLQLSLMRNGQLHVTTTMTALAPLNVTLNKKCAFALNNKQLIWTLALAVSSLCVGNVWMHVHAYYRRFLVKFRLSVIDRFYFVMHATLLM